MARLVGCKAIPQVPRHSCAEVPSALDLRRAAPGHSRNCARSVSAKGVEIVEGHAIPDPIHLRPIIPPQFTAANTKGFLQRRPVSGCVCCGRRACLVSTPATCKSNGQRQCSGTGPYGPRQCRLLDLASWRKERLAAPPAGAAELSRIRYAKSSRWHGRRDTLQLPLLLWRHQVPFCLDFLIGGSGADGSSAGLRQLPRRRDAQRPAQRGDATLRRHRVGSGLHLQPSRPRSNPGSIHPVWL